MDLASIDKSQLAALTSNSFAAIETRIDRGNLKGKKKNLKSAGLEADFVNSGGKRVQAQLCTPTLSGTGGTRPSQKRPHL